MSKKLFLTSVFVACTFVPVYAGATYVTNASTCNDTTLGSDSSASLIAEWTPLTYSENPGQYLLYDSVNGTVTEHQTCPANSYCPGFTNQTFNDASIGINACSTVGDTTYTLSAAGATSPAYCYKTTTTTCAAKNPYYYGHGTANYATSGSINCKIYAQTDSLNNLSGGNICTLDTVASCAITSLSCATGYSSTGTNGALAAYVNENAPYDNQFTRYKSNDGNNTKGDQTGLSNGDWSVKWMDSTTVTGIASCNTNGSATAYFQDNYGSVLNSTMTAEAFFTGFAAVATSAQVERVSSLFTQYASNKVTSDEVYMRITKELYADSTANYTTSSTGQYCWCKMNGYSLLGGATQTVSNSSWVFIDTHETSGDCASNCTYLCVNAVINQANFRNAIFGSLGANMECTPNTISLDWDPDNGSSHTNNTCTYDGAITLPTEPTKPGYQFAGWAVVTPSNNN